MISILMYDVQCVNFTYEKREFMCILLESLLGEFPMTYISRDTEHSCDIMCISIFCEAKPNKMHFVSI